MPDRFQAKHYFTLLLFVVVWQVAAAVAFAQGTAFSYQGRLTDAANPADGLFDMQFKLFDTPTVGTGTQQGSTITNPSVQVAAGIFTVQLDFSHQLDVLDDGFRVRKVKGRLSRQAASSPQRRRGTCLCFPRRYVSSLLSPAAGFPPRRRRLSDRARLASHQRRRRPAPSPASSSPPSPDRFYSQSIAQTLLTSSCEPMRPSSLAKIYQISGEDGSDLISDSASQEQR